MRRCEPITIDSPEFTYWVIRWQRCERPESKRVGDGLEADRLVLRGQACFDALDQPLPPGRVGRPLCEGEGAEDWQVGLHRQRQRRGGHAGQPRVRGLHGRVERARPFRIRSFGGIDGVGKGNMEAAQSMILGPSAVMITLLA